jgi:L-aminopeptidase/D-esterase-like protein
LPTVNATLTAVPGIKVGHAHDPVGMTGCTVVLSEGGAVGGVDQRGGAPGTRETDLLRPMHLVTQVHGLVLAGGSAFGLAAADGVVRYLRERNIGYKTGKVHVPIVPAAILFDLALGRPDAFPDAEMGYQASVSANTGPVTEGNAGAGIACSAGKILGPGHATKTGIGSAAVQLGAGLVVAALIAVNPFGDVVDQQGRVIAGTRREGRFVNTLAMMRSVTGRLALRVGGATVIGVVATNARLNKEQVNKVAQMAHDGLGRTIRPAHTMFDGDTIFALATSQVRASPTLVGAYAAEVVAEAIVRAAQAAEDACGLPCGENVLALRR